MRLLHIIYRAQKETESTPNLTMEFTMRLHPETYVFSMMPPLETKGDYPVINLPRFKSVILFFPLLFIKHPIFCIHYLFSKKTFNFGWIKTNLINLCRYGFLFHFINKSNITHVNIFFGDIGEIFTELKRILPIKLYVSFHGHESGIRYLNSFKAVRKYCDAYFVLCEFMKKELIAGGLNEKLIHVVKTGLDFSMMSIDKKLLRKNQILYVGRLVEMKAIIDAIQAFNIIHKKHPETRLIVAGDGPLRKKAQALAHQLNLNSVIDFLGHRIPSDIYNLMHESKIFFLPSKVAANGNKEGTPCAILEAQAIGLPVVSTYHAGIPEIVLNGETALLSQEGDVENLAKSLDTLLSDETLWNSFSEKARKYVRENYSIEKRARILLKTFQRL